MVYLRHTTIIFVERAMKFSSNAANVNPDSWGKGDYFTASGNRPVTNAVCRPRHPHRGGRYSSQRDEFHLAAEIEILTWHCR